MWVEQQGCAHYEGLGRARQRRALQFHAVAPRQPAACHLPPHLVATILLSTGSYASSSLSLLSLASCFAEAAAPNCGRGVIIVLGLRSRRQHGLRGKGDAPPASWPTLELGPWNREPLAASCWRLRAAANLRQDEAPLRESRGGVVVVVADIEVARACGTAATPAATRATANLLVSEGEPAHGNTDEEALEGQPGSL